MPAGATLLRDLHAGTDPALLEPCLATFATEADRQTGRASGAAGGDVRDGRTGPGHRHQPRNRRGGSRFAANARDPKVAQAIRRRQDAEDKLADLYRQRDALAGNAPPGAMPLGPSANLADVDKQITDAQTESGRR